MFKILQRLSLPPISQAKISSVSSTGILKKGNEDNARIVHGKARFVYYSDHSIRVFGDDSVLLLTAHLADFDIKYDRSYSTYYEFKINSEPYSFRLVQLDTINTLVALLNSRLVTSVNYLPRDHTDPFFRTLLRYRAQYMPENNANDPIMLKSLRSTYRGMGVLMLVLGLSFTATIFVINGAPIFSFIMSALFISASGFLFILGKNVIRKKLNTPPRPIKSYYRLSYLITATLIAGSFGLAYMGHTVGKKVANWVPTQATYSMGTSGRAVCMYSADDKVYMQYAEEVSCGKSTDASKQRQIFYNPRDPNEITDSKTDFSRIPGVLPYYLPAFFIGEVALACLLVTWYFHKIKNQYLLTYNHQSLKTYNKLIWVAFFIYLCTLLLPSLLLL